MAEPLWLEDARMWLTKKAHERRRLDLLIAIAMLMVSAASLALGVFLIGVPITGGVLMGMGVLYLVYGRVTANRPMISAETSRPRLLGVIRNPSMTRHAYEQGWVEASYAIGFLMAPIHLVVEAARMLIRRRKLRELEADTPAALIARLVDARCAIEVVELEREYPGVAAAIEQLQHLRGVVLLRNPDRLSLTDAVIDEIRAE